MDIEKRGGESRPFLWYRILRENNELKTPSRLAGSDYGWIHSLLAGALFLGVSFAAGNDAYALGRRKPVPPPTVPSPPTPPSVCPANMSLVAPDSPDFELLLVDLALSFELAEVPGGWASKEACQLDLDRNDALSVGTISRTEAELAARVRAFPSAEVQSRVDQVCLGQAAWSDARFANGARVKGIGLTTDFLYQEPVCAVAERDGGGSSFLVYRQAEAMIRFRCCAGATLSP